MIIKLRNKKQFISLSFSHIRTSINYQLKRIPRRDAFLGDAFGEGVGTGGAVGGGAGAGATGTGAEGGEGDGLLETGVILSLDVCAPTACDTEV